MINIYLCLCANIIFNDGSVHKFICKPQEASFSHIASSEIGSPYQHSGCPEGSTETQVPPACSLCHPQLYSLVLPCVILWTVIAGCSTSKVHVPKETGQSGQSQGRTGTCFSQEEKPSPVTFTYLSLTTSSYKRTEIKFVAFTSSMAEPGQRWEKSKLETFNQVFQARISLSHIIRSTYFLIFCDHILI